MREYGVEVCSEECGMLVVPPSYDSQYRGVMWTYMGSPVSAQLRYCPFCGTRVGVERRENGSIAWREAMVPRAALEYVARCWARYDPGEVNPDEAIAYALKHAENAALKAAEEATR